MQQLAEGHFQKDHIEDGDPFRVPVFQCRLDDLEQGGIFFMDQAQQFFPKLGRRLYWWAVFLVKQRTNRQGFDHFFHSPYHERRIVRSVGVMVFDCIFEGFAVEALAEQFQQLPGVVVVGRGFQKQVCLVALLLCEILVQRAHQVLVHLIVQAIELEQAGQPFVMAQGIHEPVLGQARGKDPIALCRTVSRSAFFRIFLRILHYPDEIEHIEQV